MKELEPTTTRSTRVQQQIGTSILAAHPDNGYIEGFVTGARVELVNRHIDVAALERSVADLPTRLPLDVLALVLTVEMMTVRAALRGQPMPSGASESARDKKLPIPLADGFALGLGPFVPEGLLFAHLDRFVDGEMR